MHSPKLAHGVHPCGNTAIRGYLKLAQLLSQLGTSLTCRVTAPSESKRCCWRAAGAPLTYMYGTAASAKVAVLLWAMVERYNRVDCVGIVEVGKMPRRVMSEHCAAGSSPRPPTSLPNIDVSFTRLMSTAGSGRLSTSARPSASWQGRLDYMHRCTRCCDEQYIDSLFPNTTYTCTYVQYMHICTMSYS